MRLKTYRANSLAEALAAVKRDLGRNAVILHTRTVRASRWWWPTKKRDIVEVIASDEVNVAGPRLRAPARRVGAETRAAVEVKPSIPAPAPQRRVVEAYQRAGEPAATAPRTTVAAVAAPTAVALAETAVAMLPPADTATDTTVLPVRERKHAAVGTSRDSDGLRTRGHGGTAAPAKPSRLATPVRFSPQDSTARTALEAELADIKIMVGQVLQSTSPTAAAGLMPEALFKHYLKLLQGQVARDLADRIIGAVRDELNPGELMDESIVRQTLLRHIAALIPVAPSGGAQAAATPARPADGRPLTVALIGPTGVGKTTTIAKLAATYKLRYGKRVGLITSDTYRIAAVEQLRTYANIIALPLQVVMTPAEMGAACETLADCDIILIDTAGRSQHDALRLEELRGFIQAAAPHETHLVLSSAASEAVLLKTATQFSALGPNRVILTKLDEAVNFGVVITVAERIGAAFSYVTTGQEVPDHIEPGHADRLARLVLDGELKR